MRPSTCRLGQDEAGLRVRLFSSSSSSRRQGALGAQLAMQPPAGRVRAQGLVGQGRSWLQGQGPGEEVAEWWPRHPLRGPVALGTC